MSHEAVERLLGRLLTDDSFRTKAEKFIERICRETGYDVSAGELNCISKNDIARLNVDAFANSLCHAGKVLSGIHDFSKL